MTHTSSSLSLRTDLSFVPAGSPATRYLLVSMTAPEAERSAIRPSINVSFVLDRSGSMGGTKIALAREAVQRALSMLHSDDRFSLVAYDDEVKVVVETATASAEARRNAMRKLESIDARGNTDLAGGWLAGCEQVAPHLADEPAGRCLLLTDGLANHGETNQDALADRARALRDRHIATSTFGVGDDFDEELLRRIAEGSGGHFYFIEQPRQIPDLLTSELGEALEVVTRGASLAIQLPAGAKAWPLTGFEWCPTDSGIRIALCDLVSRQEVEVVVRVDLPALDASAVAAVRVSMADRDGALSIRPTEQGWTAVGPNDAANQRRDRVVDRVVAELYAARAQHEALALNREGRFDQARALLDATARRISSYAGTDRHLVALVRRLREAAVAFADAMSAGDRKARHFAAYSAMQSRTVDGKARRKKNA
jgi:Ca-activated chloride channel homolog